MVGDIVRVRYTCSVMPTKEEAKEGAKPKVMHVPVVIDIIVCADICMYV